jgi:hypothetical protein
MLHIPPAKGQPMKSVSIQKVIFWKNNWITLVIAIFFLLSLTACSKTQDVPSGNSNLASIVESKLNAALCGKPLAESFVNQDGLLVQVFDNVVAVAPPSNPADFHLIAIGKESAYLTTSPGPQLHGSDENVRFLAVQGELGYHIPMVFDQYINTHGGMELSGNPISETTIFEQEKMACQCYENYCLEYHPGAPEENQVTPVKLGERWLEQSGMNANITPDGLLIQVSEEQVQLPPSESQTIHVYVFQKGAETPVPNVEARVVVATPAGEEFTFFTSPTDSEGRASLTVPPIPGVKVGNLISYQVCLNNSTENPVCAYETYIIWDVASPS